MWATQEALTAAELLARLEARFGIRVHRNTLTGLLVEHVGKPLTVILDSASVHTARALRPYLRPLPKGLTLYLLPPYSPELNRIEKLWHKMKYEWLAFKARDTKVLEADVEVILQGFGADYGFHFLLKAYCRIRLPEKIKYYWSS
ncbi:transposase [Cupriavidus sp. UME77]|uniref:transposase n=1 Tax=Cupriavidus sp. UME77 TaxID=1862321 RepID=UPI001602D85E|nr:transposase [Cupriavidus sp. UME77]MBB1630908.1 hypothetical protein [Cupriavidus sp. UME77]